MKRFSTILLLLAVVTANGWAQKAKTIEYTYTYIVPPNESVEQAKRSAVNYARVEALKEEFGTVISGASASSLISKNNITDSKFVSLSSEGELNGEWLADLEEPNFEMLVDEGKIRLIVTIKGKAREIINNTITFEAKILRGKPTPEFESSEFTAGNRVFVNFTSPVDGYLAIYFLDGESAYCLLPYSEDNDGLHPIIHGKEYTFFSREVYNEGDEEDIIDEYALTTEEEHQELNQFYFIFSPRKFVKATDKFKKSSDGTIFPRTLPWEDFQKWIIQMRSKDKEMCVQTKYIVISPNN